MKTTHLHPGIEASLKKKKGMADSSYKAGDLPFNYVVNSREMPRGWQATQMRRKT